MVNKLARVLLLVLLAAYNGYVGFVNIVQNHNDVKGSLSCLLCAASLYYGIVELRKIAKARKT